MTSLAEIREKYPAYADLSDEQLADGLYQKFYSDMDRAEFDNRVGLAPANEGGSLLSDALDYVDEKVRGLPDQLSPVGETPAPSASTDETFVENVPAQQRPPSTGTGVVEATKIAIGNVPARWRQAGAGIKQGSALARVAQIDRAIETFDSSNLYGQKYNAEVAGAFEAFAEAGGLINPSITDPVERARALAPLADNLTPEQRTAFRNFYAQQYEQSAEEAAGEFTAARESMTPTGAEPGSATYYVSSIAGSLGEMGPAFLASFVTGSPLPAMGAIGLLVGGTSFGEGIEEGLSPEDAANRAMLMAGAEAISELVPLHILLKPGSALFKRMAQAGITEAGQEMITEGLKIGIDSKYFDKDITWGEVVSQVADAGIIGAGAGTALGAAASGVGAAKGAVADVLPDQDPGKAIGREMGQQLKEPSMADRIDAHLRASGDDAAVYDAPPPQPEAPFDP
jgi:hypothetical protein